ncbi:Hypothetical protein NTJ_07389 [Nesidiocoris tenuis]|uniref:Uncharacterized protein n=1 Tax=Nesidiocoris tenuis TaxID=355587 RepID=A0ABN7AQV2_9HEMI|nr:Hypothetical protein NTJ_07389 [Nesidiocoris tenuis]
MNQQGQDTSHNQNKSANSYVYQATWDRRQNKSSYRLGISQYLRKSTVEPYSYTTVSKAEVGMRDFSNAPSAILLLAERFIPFSILKGGCTTCSFVRIELPKLVSQKCLVVQQIAPFSG